MKIIYRKNGKMRKLNLPSCIFFKIFKIILLFKSDLIASISREDLDKIIDGLRAAKRVWKHLEIIAFESKDGEFFSVSL